MLVKRDNEVFAKKVPRKENVIKHTKSERNALEVASRLFIVQFHYAFQKLSQLNFGLECYPGDVLFFHFSSASRFSENRCRSNAPEILLTVEYPHRLNTSYCDLKPGNILLGL